jgi:excinuclease ABC subunit A
MGPEGGEEGGRLMAAGTPEEVAAVEESYTGRFLRDLLDQAPAKGRRRAAGTGRSRRKVPTAV